MKHASPELDRIVDLVLAYRPKPKTKPGKKRAKKKKEAQSSQKNQ